MTGEAQRIVSKLLAPLRRRVQLMVARAVLETIDDGKKLQTLQISMRADELRDDVERFQQFGFTSRPKAGAEAIVLLVGGGSDHPVVIAVDDRRYRPTGIDEGEVALYTMQDGKRVHCKANGDVLLGSAPTDAVALAPLTKSELDKMHTYLAIFDAIVTGSVINEAGMGAPSVFQTVLKAALSGQLQSVGEVAAQKVKAE